MRRNVGKTFQSPRKGFLESDTLPLKINNIDEHLEKVEIDFVGRKSKALPLFFWMFDRALEYIQANKERFIRLGAKVEPPHDYDTVEGQIWHKPYPYPTPFKTSPHICDFLVLAGLAEYGFVKNLETGRRVQGIKYIGAIGHPAEPSCIEPTDKADEKADFIRKYKQTINELPCSLLQGSSLGPLLGFGIYYS
jgi:hypothetical protein